MGSSSENKAAASSPITKPSTTTTGGVASPSNNSSENKNTNNEQKQYRLTSDDDTVDAYDTTEENDDSEDLDDDDDDSINTNSLFDNNNDDEVDNSFFHDINYHIIDTTLSSNNNNSSSLDYDEKQLFFPPNYHPVTFMGGHHTNNNGGANNNSNNSSNKSGVGLGTTTTSTKSNIPSYFLCPITNQIMIDPVIDHEGNTYEHHAILRWLILYTNISPVTGNYITMEELKSDKLVKVAIDKARRDAWVRYILELELEGTTTTTEEGNNEKKKNESNEKKKRGGKKSASPSKEDLAKTKSDLENYLDRSSNKKKSGGGATTTGSKHGSGGKSGGGSSSGSVGKKKIDANTPPTAAGASPSPPAPSSSSKKQQNNNHLRPKTPPPSSKILHQKKERVGSIKSTKSTKSNSSSTTLKSEKSGTPAPLPPSQAGGGGVSSPEASTKPTSTITVPNNKKPTFSPSSTPSAALGTHISSNTSITSAISFTNGGMHNGWTVPLGVHKLICSSPGLHVTTAVHRRSTPVKRVARDINNNLIRKELIISPGSYVEILETQVHGGRVRGRITWEEEDLENRKPIRRKKKKKKKKGNKKSLFEKRPKRKSKMFQRGRTKKKDDEEDDNDSDDDSDSGGEEENMVRYTGWISVQWADGEEDEDGNVIGRPSSSGGGGGVSGLADEDAGPWTGELYGTFVVVYMFSYILSNAFLFLYTSFFTEPIPLGVYRISFGAGLPLRETPERDSAVLDKLERGRCVEVVETTVKGDRVRARCLVPPLPQEGDDAPGKKPARFQSGWISLLNALTGASGASPVPLGAYVAVAEGGCIITEGGRLDSKEKGTLNPGSCIEVVATRIEEGTVRGLIAAGGHVTLFVLNGAATNRLAAMGGSKNSDGGRMFAMPVPLGTYQVVQNGLSVTSGLSLNSPVNMKLKVNACAEIAETRVEGGRVRGRLTAVGYGGVAKEVNGWMSLFEPTQRWAKIVCFKGGRPISPQQEQAQP
jgi:hypothetical protein